VEQFVLLPVVMILVMVLEALCHCAAALAPPVVKVAVSYWALHQVNKVDRSLLVVDRL
jgi:hypothetical protein